MAQVALRKANIGYGRYQAAEIDKHAIAVAQSNFPETQQIGDVRTVSGAELGQPGLLLAGSPCQGFSFSGKGLNFNDPRSKLFFEFVRILEESNPQYWLLENVVMKKEHQDVISGILGVEPVKLNSALTSAQNRVRLYWANFPITEPEDQHWALQDVIQASTMRHPAAVRGRRAHPNQPVVQWLEVRSESPDAKSNCLTTVAKDTVVTSLPKGKYPDAFARKLPFRNYTTVERCRLMNLPDDYCRGVSTNQAVKITGNGWETGMITHIFECLTKHATFTLKN